MLQMNLHTHCDVVTIYACMYVCADYRPSRSAYLAGILAERWNKREEEIRGERDQTERRWR